MCEAIPPNFRAGAVGPGQTSEVWRLLDWALRNQGRPLTTVNAGPNHLTPMNGVKGRRHSRAAFDAPIDKAHASPNASGMTSLPVTQARFSSPTLDQAADSLRQSKLPASVRMPFSCPRRLAKNRRRLIHRSRARPSQAWPNCSTKPPPNPVGDRSIAYTRQAQKDARKIASQILNPKLSASRHHRQEPFQYPPPCEKLVGVCGSAFHAVTVSTVC